MNPLNVASLEASKRLEEAGNDRTEGICRECWEKNQFPPKELKEKK